MKIDRHNYEEFFILYWDNELNSLQKRAVEEFVNGNPDLKEEFKIFGETKFNPDITIQLDAKKFLLNDTFINITNYEEQLLDYIDNELPVEQKLEVEKFADQFPAIQKELALLQKAKIQPDAEIQFPDKSILYRKEEKVKVISFYWRRIAVAAAVLLIGGFITLKIVNSSTVDVEPRLVNSTNGNEKENNQQTKITPTDTNGNLASTEPGSTKDPIPTSTKKEMKNVSAPNESSSIKSSLAINQKENKNNLPEEGTKTNQPGILNTTESNTTTSPTFAYIPDSDRIDVGKAQTTNPEYVNTAFNNSDVTLKSGYALNIETPPIVPVDDNDGGGIKEFLRKTTRVFERRTKIQTTTDDNKLLVGAFAVSLK